MDHAELNQFQIKKNGFIGYRLSGDVGWCGTDSQALWEKNLATIPDDPAIKHYRTKDIVYSRNKLGHRSAEVEEVVRGAEPYMLIVGDSFSEGVGLANDEIYPQLVGSELGMAVYNLALGGTGTDTFMHNLFMWKNRVRRDPAVLVIQWTQIFRTYFSEHLEPQFIINGTIPFLDSDRGQKFIDAGLDLRVFATRAIVLDRVINELFPKSTVINLHISFWHDKDADYGVKNSVVWNGPADYARDLQHWGPKSHAVAAQGILNKLAELNK